MQTTSHRLLNKLASRLTLITGGLIVCWIAYQLYVDVMKLHVPGTLNSVDHSDNTRMAFIKPYVYFRQQSINASLDVFDSTVLQVLQHIASSMQIELMVAPETHSTLRQKISVQRND